MKQFLKSILLLGILLSNLSFSAYAQLSTCGNTSLANVNRLVNVKVVNNDIFLIEGAPASTPQGRVIRKNLTTNAQTTVFGGLDFPLGLDIHPTTGMLYVGERGFANGVANNRIRVINPNTGTQVTQFSANNGNSEWSDALTIDQTGRLFVIVNTGTHSISSQSVTNTRISVYNTNAGNSEIILTGIPLMPPNNAIRFLDLDTYTDMATGITHLVVSNASNGNIHVFDIQGNNVISQRTFASGHSSVANITVDTNKFIHATFGNNTLRNTVRSYCFSGTQVASQAVNFPQNANGWLNGIDVQGGTIYTPFCNATANYQNDAAYCLNFTPVQSAISISGSGNFTLGSPVIFPLSLSGLNPTNANPVTVAIQRQPSGEIFYLNLQNSPYQFIDASILNAGTYTYSLVSASSTNACNITLSGTYTATIQNPVPPLVCGDLWGQDMPEDDGDEAASCSRGGVAWQSPDIWLSPNPNAYNDNTDQKPQPGQINYVYVKVRNRGNATDNGKLHLYWTAASTGLYWANSWTGVDVCQVTNTPLGGEFLQEATDESGNVVTANNISVVAGGEKVYRFSWLVPTPSSYANCFFADNPVDTHHFCLLARIEQDSIQNCRQNLPKNETNNTYNNAICNNNIYWQNIMILDEAGGGKGAAFTAGVIARAACIPQHQWTANQTVTPTNVGCVPVTYNFTWKPVSNAPNFWNHGLLYIKLPLNTYNDWVAAGSPGKGIVDFEWDGWIYIEKPHAYISLNLGLAGYTSIAHHFFPHTQEQGEISMDLVQEACNANDICKIVGGQRFVLRNFVQSFRHSTNFSEMIKAEKESQQEAITVTAYPNPAEDVLNLDFSTTSSQQIAIYDLTGKLMLTQETNKSKKAAINVARLPKGVYMIHLTDEKGKVTIRRFAK
jgi:hypothetical protein